VVSDDAGVGLHAVLVVAAAVLWAVAATLFALIPDEPGATDNGRNALAEARDLGPANLVSSPVWGRLADRVSSRRVMILAGVVGVATAGVAVAFDVTLGSGLPALAYAPVLFAAGMGIAGVRLGRKTWLVDFADAPRRPLFVAVSNTLIGGVTFAYGGFGFVGDAVGIRSMLGLLGVLAAAGAAAAWWMPEASEGPAG
jgi:MFS family permease